NHTAEGSVLVGQTFLAKTVPVFVAVMVWMIRVLIIGTFSLAGENMFSVADARSSSRLPMQRPVVSTQRVQPASSYPRPSPKPLPRPVARPEPTYHPVGMSAQSYEDNPSTRR